MAIKMAQLMKATGETRSTLLFYVKEGLLREPSKPKPNVHLYSDDSIQRVHLIKTLQHQLHYSINQIKQVFAANDFDFEEGVESLVQKLELLSGTRHKRYKSIADAIEVYGLTKAQINSYEERGLLETQEGYLSDHSWRMLQILSDLEGLEESQKLLDEYVQAAKALAHLEYDAGAQMVQMGDNNHGQELFLDLILSLKPYIFNLHSKAEHQRRSDV